MLRNCFDVYSRSVDHLRLTLHTFRSKTRPLGVSSMASQYLTKGLKRSALTVALGLCFVGGVNAQTNTAGAIAGHAAAGDTITITNPATGFSRTITVGADGSYRFSQLPIGQYQVSRNGGAARNVNVSVGTAANVDFVQAGTAERTRHGRSRRRRCDQPDRRHVGRVDHHPDRRTDRQDPGSARHDLGGAARPGYRARRRGVRQPGFVRRFVRRRKPVLHQRLQHHQLVPQPELLERSVRGDRRNSRSRPVVTAPNSVVRWAA